MERLVKKWETAKGIVPRPYFYQQTNMSPLGVLFFGTSTYSSEEAIDLLREQEIVLDAMRIKSFPFNAEVEKFIEAHEVVFVIEQNRDAQMRSLLINELEINPKKLIRVLNYDGMPITADKIVKEISKNLVTT